MKSRLPRWRLGSKQALHPRCVREVQCAQGIVAICFPLTTAAVGRQWASVQPASRSAARVTLGLLPGRLGRSPQAGSSFPRVWGWFPSSGHFFFLFFLEGWVSAISQDSGPPLCKVIPTFEVGNLGELKEAKAHEAKASLPRVSEWVLLGYFS